MRLNVLSGLTQHGWIQFLFSACTTESCSGHIIQADFSSIDALRFNRTFTWNLAAAAPKAFQIDFTNTGLKQINPSEKCPDRHTYTLQAFQSTGNVAVGKYCRSGTISSAQVLKSGSFSVDVPAEQKLQNDKFDVTVREKIKCEFTFIVLCFFQNYSVI